MSARSRGTVFVAVFLSLLAISVAVDIIHEKGRCLWYKQCTDQECPKSDDGQYYNLYNNSWHINVTEQSDKQLFDLLEEVCPMYIDNTSTAHVCCDAAQVQTLKTNVQQAQSLISRCPACLKNFIKHYCITTCDPSGSLFMDGDIYKSNDSGTVYEYVHNVSLYFTEKYAADLYNSCANVQFSGGGSKVMGLLCGTTNCSPYKWLDFMGDPKKNGDEAPFLMTYLLYPNSSSLPNGIAPMDDTGIHSMYNCNQTVGKLGSCSCSDCPSVCPAPPTFSTQHIPFKIIALSIGSTGFVISSVIFIVALVSSFFVWNKYRRGGYRPISGEGVPPNSAYGATSAPRGGGDKESSTSSSINSDVDEDEDDEKPLTAMGRCCQIGHYVERQIQLVFYHWGRFVTKFWYLVLILAIIVAGSLSFGLFFFTVTTDPVKLWSAPTSRARLEKNYFDNNFGPFYRTEQIIVKAKPGVEGPVVSPPGTVNLTWTFGPVFNHDLLVEVLRLQNYLANMVVEYNDGEEHVSNITLQDICFSPLAPENKNCTIDSVINYFQNDETILNKTIDFFYDYSYHIHYCTRFPFSLNETQSHFNTPCIGTFGGDVDPKVALGGFNETADGSGYDYDTSTVLIITFVVNNHVSDEQNKKAMAWEKAYLAYLKDYKHKARYINIEFSAERSIIDEINRESETDIYTIAASYLLMFFYITIFLGHIRSFSTIVVDMKLGVGFVGVLLVLFAVTSSLGFYSYMKVEASLIVLEVVPFLVLAVGVDNLFILVHSYERQLKKFAAKHDGCNWEQIPLSEIIGRAVGDVAPSLLLTGLAETTAFLLGAVSVMPAVRTFSLYAGTAVFFNLLLQLSVFVAVMALDAMRQLRNRVDILACISLKGKFDPRIGRDFLSIIMKYFAHAILYPLVRPFILLIYGLTLTMSLIFMFRIEVGLNQNLALPKDSYLIPYFNELFANLHTGSPVYFVMKDGINYTNDVSQNEICSGAGCFDNSLGNQITIYARAPNESGIAESPLNWLDSYFAWVGIEGGCCGYYNTTTPSNPVLCDTPEPGTNCIPCIAGNRPNPTEFKQFLKYFLAANPNTTCASGGHAAFGDAVILEKDNQTVITSYIMTYHNSLQTSAEFINALKRARELTANITAMMGGSQEVFPYSVFYVYYEQYLNIVRDMLQNIGLALLAVFVVSFLLMGFNIWAAAMIFGIVASIIVHMLGSMAMLGINANAVSLVNLVMTVGIAVEFCAHIVRWFVSCSLPTRTQRAHSALHQMGASVVSGITVTKFLGVFVLLFAKSQLFEIYYFRMYMCMLFWGALHGLIVLPVLLSYIGPAYYPNKMTSPYNQNYLIGAPTVPAPISPQKQPPVVSYDDPAHQNTAPPTYTNDHQQYPAPTRHNTNPTTHGPSLYPALITQQYPEATRPRDGYNNVDETTRLLN